MKFLCDRCKTRYSIGDDRVRGKILKIRCKNCANVITVREGMTDAESAEPAGAAPHRTVKPTTLAPPIQAAMPTPPPANGAKPPAALEEEWYVSIDGDQSGPFSLAEAQRWIAAKVYTADLHCWSEGFDDWLPVDKVSHFRGLRKKPTAAQAAQAAHVPPAPPARVIAAASHIGAHSAEEEPKPLFAATMAAIERSVAPAPIAAPPTPLRSTPQGGLPAMAKPVTNGSAPYAALMPTPQPFSASAPAPSITPRALGVPAIPVAALAPKASTGPVSAIKSSTGPMPAFATKASTGPVQAMRTPTGPSAALAFDASDHGASTEVEQVPFQDQVATQPGLMAAKPRALPAPFTPSAAPLVAQAPAFVPPPVSVNGKASNNGPSAPMFPPGPTPAAPSSFMTAPAAYAPDPFAPPPPHDPFMSAGAAPSARPMFPDPEPEGDIEIGEVSRVVNLADLARSATAARGNPAPLRKANGAMPRLRTAAIDGDPIDAMVAMPDASSAEQAVAAPEGQTTRANNKKLYFLLGGVLLILVVIVGTVVFVVSRNDDDTGTAIRGGREIDLARPDDPRYPVGGGSSESPPKDPATLNPLTPRTHPNNTPHIPTGSNKPIGVDPPDNGTGVPGTSLKPEEVEAMARTQSDATNRCYMRAQRGADAITIGEVKRINVTLTIDREGTVTGVDLSDHANDSLGKCLASRIRGWHFHGSANGLTTRLTLVFQAS